MEEKLQECEFLIRSIAKKFYNVEREDLYQAGCLGLIKAYYNYSDDSIPFSSYSYKYIFGEMYELYRKSRDIKVTKEFLRSYKVLAEATEYLTNKFKRTVTDIELSEFLGLTLEEIGEIRLMSETTLSLDDEFNKIDIGETHDLDLMLDIKTSIENLDPLSSEVMKYRINNLTQTEISKILGISQVKVSRIENLSKDKILEYIQ